MKIKIRKLEETDLPFIFSTWLKGLYHGNVLYGKVEQDLFYAKYHKVIETLLRQSKSIGIRVACLEDEPDVILGYSVTQPHEDGPGATLHWIFVKKAWRKVGIGKLLINSSTTQVSHLTKLGELLLKKTEWKFNPFLF